MSYQSAVIHAEYEFKGHNAVINTVCYNKLQDCFVSSDDTCLRLWHAATNTELRQVHLPPRTSHFIQAMTFIDTKQIYVASALDGTLKMYDQHLNELASIHTGRETILSLVFDGKHSRLFTGGVDGCGAWLVRGKPTGGVDNGVNPNYELSPIPNFFHTGLKKAVDSTPTTHTLLKPSSSPLGSTISSKSKPPKLPPHERAWVQAIQLNRDQTRLYGQGKHSIDVFSAVDGAFLETYTDLFPKENGAIMAFVVHEKSQYVVCGCRNGSIFIVSLHPTTVVHAFKDHTQSVTSLAVHASSNLILSSSLDGTVRLWDLDARRLAHRLDIGQPVHALGLLLPHSNPWRFFCRVRSAVRLFSIQSTIKEHLPSLSPISILQRFVGPADSNYQDEDDDAEDDSSESYGKDNRFSNTGNCSQLIVAAGMDKTIRLFAGRAANEAPTFTWIPDGDALDLIGIALNPMRTKLFLVLESQKILIVDITTREKQESSSTRVVDMDVTSTSSSMSTKSDPPTAGRRSSNIMFRSTRNIGGPGAAAAGEKHTNASVNGRQLKAGGALRSICCCYYPPMFRSALPTAASTGNMSSAAQSKYFSRTFVNRKKPSNVELELKKMAEESEHENDLALIHSRWEWIVCGTELGHLLFWHTGLSNNAKEAISIDAHDGSVVAVFCSASSPLLVSLDENKHVNLWSFQPLFMLQNMLDLSERPSCFVLSHTSDLLLSGYEDGSVILMNLSDLDSVETFTSDENHFAMISAADFLDEKHLVLTASVDAVIKIWDQQKHLLRNVSIASALTCLCFMNPHGDVMAGLSTGIFIISRNDILPDKLPQPSLKKKTNRHINHSPQSQSAQQSNRLSVVQNTKTEEGHDMLAAKQTEAVGSARVIKTLESTSASFETDDRGRIVVPWKRSREMTLSCLVQMKNLVSELQPPILRSPGNNNVKTSDRFDCSSRERDRLGSPAVKVSSLRYPLRDDCQSLSNDKDEDWREELMPSSPFRLPRPTGSHTHRSLRKAPPSPLLLSEELGLSPRASRISHRPADSWTPGTDASEPSPSCLSIGKSAGPPMQYCKHQAPVPPKEKTPRKLWNAIGGEDRRLIVLQRNLPPF